MKKSLLYSLFIIFFSVFAVFASNIIINNFSQKQDEPSHIVNIDFHKFEQDLISEIRKSETNTSISNNETHFNHFNDSENEDFSSKRLIVKGIVNENYGAYKDICGYKNYHILCYSTIKQTENAYNKFLSNNIDVQPDGVVKIESASDNNYTDYTSYNSWGAKYMDVADYLTYLREIDNQKEVVVAVIDTGINTSHVLFKDRILKDKNNNLIGHSFCASTYTYSGYDFEDDNGHGSHVAGTICELTPANVKILPIKVLNHEGKCYNSEVLLGYSKIIEEFSLQYNIVAVSTSISGFYNFGSSYVDLLQKNIIPVVSSGNDSRSVSGLIEGDVEKCVLVSATKIDNNLITFDHSYSNYGYGIDISAPGTNIKSAWIGEDGTKADSNEYKTISGTSMATPHVSATVALLSLGLENYNADELIDRLLDSALDYGTIGYDNYYGHGFVNCKNLRYKKANVKLNIRVDNQILDLSSNNPVIRFDNDVDLKFECSDISFVIKYTTDGSVPNLDSNTYLTNLKVQGSDGFISYNIIAYKLDNMGLIKEYSSMYNISFAYINAPIGDCVKVNSDGFITEYWGVHDNIVIPEQINGITIQGIDKEVFGWNDYLKSVELPITCSHIGIYGFKGCTNLKYINAPGVETIDYNAFGLCNSLPFITSDAKEDNVQEGAYFPALREFTSTSYIILYGETWLRYGGVFSSCEGIEYIKLESLQDTTGRSFDRCKKLKSCYLPNATVIEAEFQKCDNLEFVYAPKATKISDNVLPSFSECPKLNFLTTSEPESYNTKGCFLPSLKIIEQTDYINKDGIFDKSYLRVINLKGVESIPYLGRMDYLEEIYLYDTTSISPDAFEDCSNLKKIAIGEEFSSYNTEFMSYTDATIYCIENSFIHERAKIYEHKCELMVESEFIKNITYKIIKNPIESSIISVDAGWGVFYQWYTTTDSLQNATILTGENNKYLEIPSTIAEDTYIFCEVTDWNNTIRYSSIGQVEFNPSFKVYEIKWKNSNGDTILKKYMKKGEIPIYDGEIPTKDSTEQYDYTFQGWDKEFTQVTGNQVYTAVYSESLRKYNVIFLNYDNTIFRTSTFEYGSEIPNYYNRILLPTRESTQKYDYHFSKWDKEFTVVTSDQEYKAIFREQVRYYVVYFINDDNSILHSVEIKYSELPKYDAEIPKKEKNTQYSYEFQSWDREFAEVTSDQFYRAVYTGILNKYLVTFYNYNNKLLLSDYYEYGTYPIYNGSTPFKPSTYEFDYIFNGWGDLLTVTEDAVYYAQFQEKPADTTNKIGDKDIAMRSESLNINAKWHLEIQTINDKSTLNSYKNLINQKNITICTALKINICQGNEKILEGTASSYMIQMPLDNNFSNKKVDVYYIDDNNKLVLIGNSVQDGNMLSFHKSSDDVTYIIVAENPTNNNLKYSAVAVVIAVILVTTCIILKKKKNKTSN